MGEKSHGNSRTFAWALITADLLTLHLLESFERKLPVPGGQEAVQGHGIHAQLPVLHRNQLHLALAPSTLRCSQATVADDAVQTQPSNH